MQNKRIIPKVESIHDATKYGTSIGKTIYNTKTTNNTSSRGETDFK
jgi:hypothetical protein